MPRRPLGATGLTVSRIGLGLAALGRPGYINLGHADDLGHDYDLAAMEARAHAVLDAAWAGGVRYFDAARSYGAAEQFLASWLASRGIAPEAVVVASKWGYTYTAGWQVEAEKHEVKDHSLPVLRRQSAESRGLARRPPRPVPDPFGHTGERRAGRRATCWRNWRGCGRRRGVDRPDAQRAAAGGDAATGAGRR